MYEQGLLLICAPEHSTEHQFPESFSPASTTPQSGPQEWSQLISPMVHNNHLGPPTSRSFVTGAPSRASSVPAYLPLHTPAPISTNGAFPPMSGNRAATQATSQSRPTRCLSSVGAFGHGVNHAQVSEPIYQSRPPESNHCTTRSGGSIESDHPDTSIHTINPAQSQYAPESGPETQPHLAEPDRYATQVEQRLLNNHLARPVQDVDHAEHNPQSGPGIRSEPVQPSHVPGQLVVSLQTSNSEHALPSGDFARPTQPNVLGRQLALGELSRNDGQPVNSTQAGFRHGSMQCAEFAAPLRHGHPQQAQQRLEMIVQPALEDDHADHCLQNNPQSDSGIRSEPLLPDHAAGQLGNSLQASNSEYSLPGVDYARSHQSRNFRRQLPPAESNQNEHPAQFAQLGPSHQPVAPQQSHSIGLSGGALQPVYTGGPLHELDRQGYAQTAQYGRNSSAAEVGALSTGLHTSTTRASYARPAFLSDGDPIGLWRNQRIPDPIGGKLMKRQV
jgi:hypothetical protein